MEAKAALVGPESGVVLDTEAAVDVDAPGIIHPWDTEDDDALWLEHPLEHGDVLRLALEDDLERVDDFLDGLAEFRHVAVPLVDNRDELFDCLSRHFKNRVACN